VKPVESVELRYRLTDRDVAAAQRALIRAFFRNPKDLAWPVAVLVLFALALALSGAAAWWWLVLLIVPLVQLLAWRQDAARRRRTAARQGQVRLRLDDTGGHVTDPQADYTFRWELYGEHAETDDVFVLRTVGKGPQPFMIIPKRGLTDAADLPRLRALLDAHLPRA
jgi:hypothetical protein